MKKKKHNKWHEHDIKRCNRTAIFNIFLPFHTVCSPFIAFIWHYLHTHTQKCQRERVSRFTFLHFISYFFFLCSKNCVFCLNKKNKWWLAGHHAFIAITTEQPKATRLPSNNAVQCIWQHILCALCVFIESCLFLSSWKLFVTISIFFSFF